jgi:hypothetical protein
LHAGALYGFVEGLMEIKVQMPPDAQTGAAGSLRLIARACSSAAWNIVISH